MLAEAAEDNDLVRVWILPGGGHGCIDAVDPAGPTPCYRNFFERWAGYAERGDARMTARQVARRPS